MSIYSLENDPEFINLQTEMVRMQQWVIDQKKRVVILFEGRDSAGKGGAIMHFIRFINPRFYEVVALNKPSDDERGQWYFQRYITHLPKPGHILFFDRSWYNRAVVEPVMGFCTKTEYERFIPQVQQFEKMMIDDGILLFKFWFSIKKSEQKLRLEERKTNPLIQWKLSSVDMEAQMKWENYTFYKTEMFKLTGTKQSPWIICDGNDKEKARKEAIRYVLNSIPYTKKGSTGERLTPDLSVIRIEDSFSQLK
ncbi:MAG: polyphosphate kinase 2 [Flavobacteriales bacterium]|nr:polyphosphate kinase 2 [Flavobacteriales bacterium]MDG2246458.1 polyphosphate kinase 2 [Flavobacteriales bacterium]